MRAAVTIRSIRTNFCGGRVRAAMAPLVLVASSLMAADRTAPNPQASASPNEAVATGPSRIERMALGGVFLEGTEDELAAAKEGYRYLLKEPLLTSDFDREAFDNVWQVWPDTLRRRAEDASLAQRRQMAMTRYGLTERPQWGSDGMPEGSPDGRDESSAPMQYVVDSDGRWTMNCLSCHGGSIRGVASPGRPNARFALQTMTEELRATKLKLGKPLARMDFGAFLVPLGSTHGTTNAVVFGMGLMNRRDGELNLTPPSWQTFTHHDMDAPPWWHFYRRPNLYIDGFAEKGHRGLMQFTLIPENGPEVFRERENDFQNVYAFLSALRPPPYDGPIDQNLAEQGRVAFDEHCASCHGTYGDSSPYPNRRVPLDVIGTDPVRLKALTVEGREKYARSWFSHFGEEDQQTTETDPDGYVAPPLDGVWASAPYFHNGSVPTLWHVLHPAQRPVVWRSSRGPMQHHGFDDERIGIAVETFCERPDDVDQKDPASIRSVFDTRRFGKSAAGHLFVDELTESEKAAVLEYLKTL